MAITIKDIAKIANVSHTTVSRALNDNPIIKKETRDKIKLIAKEHHYIPNYNARSLKLDKSFNIGLFFTSIEGGTTTSFFHDAIKGSNKVINTQGYNLVVKAIEDLEGDFSTVNTKRFDGIIVVSQSETDDPFIKDVVTKQIPIVVVNRKVDFDIHNIIYDDKQGAYDATDYLIQQGHRDIAFIKGKKEFANTNERDAGYKLALQQNGLTYQEAFTAYGTFDLKSGFDAMEEILSYQTPTAVFCSNDEMAVGAIKSLMHHGIQVPEQCSVIGFDNTSLCTFATPELTSVNRSIEHMVFIASKKLIEQVTNNDVKETSLYLECKLIKRKSVCKQ